MDIKSIRKQMGVSQEVFAQMIGVSIMTIRRWESGNTQPSRLAQKLLNELFPGGASLNAEPKINELSGTADEAFPSIKSK